LAEGRRLARYTNLLAVDSRVVLGNLADDELRRINKLRFKEIKALR
jgi:hypothetical protein